MSGRLTVRKWLMLVVVGHGRFACSRRRLDSQKPTWRTLAVGRLGLLEAGVDASEKGRSVAIRLRWKSGLVVGVRNQAADGGAAP